MPKRVGIIQSNYVPWKGYFDFIACCDEFVLFDDVQYTRRDWRNRNKVKTKDGLHWITVPVEVKGKFEQRVDETRVSGGAWAEGHLRTLTHAYGKAKGFAETHAFVESLYADLARETMLSALNERAIRAICGFLHIDTPIRRSSDLPGGDGKNERLIAICHALGADTYVSGPAAKAYMDEAVWNAAGLSVAYKSYAGYPEYEQLHPPFEDGVTVLDVIFNTGPDAARFVRSATAFEVA